MNGRLERWLATISGLTDHPLQVSYARSELAEGSPEELAGAFDELCRAVDYVNEGARDVLGAFVPLIIDPDLLERVGAIRAAAGDAQLPAACRLLRCSTRRGHFLDREDDTPNVNLPQRADGRPLTLGERRALARKPSRAGIAKLMSDPHPMVVRILLANPRLTEDDVVAMAAKRPAPREAIAEIAKAWSRRARVRMAILLNPGSAPGVAVPLLGLLSRPELAEVARAADVPAVVRTTAGELWELRPPLRSIPPPDLAH